MNDKIKVLFLINDLGLGGVEKLTVNFANSMDRIIQSGGRFRKQSADDEPSELSTRQGKAKFEKNKLIELYLEMISLFLRDLFYYRYLGAADKIANSDYATEIMRIAEKYSVDELQEFMYNTIQSIKMIALNIKPLFIFENVFLRKPGIINN